MQNEIKGTDHTLFEQTDELQMFHYFFPTQKTTDAEEVVRVLNEA